MVCTLCTPLCSEPLDERDWVRSVSPEPQLDRATILNTITMYVSLILHVLCLGCKRAHFHFITGEVTGESLSVGILSQLSDA